MATELTEKERKQNTYNKVWQHSATMKTRSSSSSGIICAYRGEDNQRCFVGALIPDGVYSKDLEGKSIGDLLDDSTFDNITDALQEQGYSTDSAFMMRLQEIHDEHFINRQEFLIRLAERYQLQAT